MGWDNHNTQNATDSMGVGSDYLQIGPGETKRIRVLLFEDQEPATYGVFKVEIKQADNVEKLLSFTSFPGCKLNNNREQAKFSFRNILNVWDYSTNSVKKFGFGTRLKDQFKALHFNSGRLPMYDINISRIGEKRDTQWFAAPVIGSSQGLPVEFNPAMITWDIYNLPEFTVVTEEEIARQLAEVGIDYVEFTRPKIYTLEEAMAYKLPFGKHKGKTLSEVFAIDTGWITWAANNARMVDLKSMCETIQNQLISGGARPQIVPPTPQQQVTPPQPQQQQVAPAPTQTAIPQTAIPQTVQVVTATPQQIVPPQAITPAIQATIPPAPPAPPAQVVTATIPTTPLVPPQPGMTREATIAQIDEAIRANPEFKNYQRVVEVMREVTAPTPNFDLRQYTEAQLLALLYKVQK